MFYAIRFETIMLGWLAAASALACTSSTTDDGSSAASDGGSGSAVAVGEDAGAPACGAPGDRGNELGVGAYCNSQSDCEGTGLRCTAEFNPTTHFCTASCADGGAALCGSGAGCEAHGTYVICVPNSCQQTPGAR